MSRLIPSYIEQSLRIEVLERKLADAVAKERERCAKVCEERFAGHNSMGAYHILMSAAAAIRKGE